MKNLLLISLLMVQLAVSLQAREFQVDKSKENLVKFISHAPMETFDGVTDKMDGYLFWADDSLWQENELYFEVDLNSIDTGIGLRNRHMRENYLHTDQYPLTYFRGKIIQLEKSPEQWKVKVQGKLFIHGVEKPMSISGNLIPLPNGFRIQAEFVVKLTDFKIKVPRIMFFKINENIELYLDFYVKEVVQ